MRARHFCMSKRVLAGVIAVAIAMAAGCGQSGAELDAGASGEGSVPEPSNATSVEAWAGAPVRAFNSTGDGYVLATPIEIGEPPRALPTVAQSVREAADATVRQWESFASLDPAIADVRVGVWLDIDHELYGLTLDYTLAERIDVSSGGPSMQFGPPAVEAGLAYIPIVDPFSYVGVSRLFVWYDLTSDAPVGISPLEYHEIIVPPDWVPLDSTSERPDD